MYQFDRLFSVEQANELIPRLEIMVHDLQLHANTLRERISSLARSDPASEIDAMKLEQIIKLHPELRQFTDQMAELASQIEALGCFLKDIDLGLIDFPADVDNETVFLCWQIGESHISTWHSVEGGFASRRPLHGAAKPYLN
jgi:hypothetical protein